MPKFGNGSELDSNPGTLDCESGILPLSHRVPQKVMTEPEKKTQIKPLTFRQGFGLISDDPLNFFL